MLTYSNRIYVFFLSTFTVPLYIFGGYAILSCSLLLILFKTSYKRVEADGAECVVSENTKF